MDHLRQQLDTSYGKEGKESVTEGWDSMQKLVGPQLVQLKHIVLYLLECRHGYMVTIHIHERLKRIGMEPTLSYKTYPPALCLNVFRLS